MVACMRFIFDSIRITLYALIKEFTKSKENNKNEKNILFLIHENGIGDVVCTLDVIKRIEEIYPAEENYKVYFGVNQGIYYFLEKINYVQKHQFIILNVGLEDREKRRCFSKFLQDFKKLDALSWETIVAFKRIGPYLKLLFMGLRVNNYNLVEFAHKKNQIDLDAVLNRFLKNLHMFYYKESEMLFSLYETAIYFFTNKKIVLDPPAIPVLAEAPPKVGERKYCIISCGIGVNHPFVFRNWPAERFARVITFIEKELNIDVYLCGDQNDVRNTEEILKHVRNTEHIYNLVGKTNFNQWIELTRNAEFVFGNDSGYIHIAAAVGTLAFVLIGYWNFGRFHPYQLSKEVKGYQSPVVLKTDINLPCKFCSINKYIIDNPQAQIAKQACDEQIKNSGIYQCIQDINVDYVITEICRHFGKIDR